jgi:RimJ/RimL family protein N-acetyltransferase
MRLETNRLIIRVAEEKDIDAIHTILQDPITMTYFVEGTYTLKQVEDIIKKNAKSNEHYVLELSSTHEVIGKISFHPWFMDDTYEIGWIMNRAYTNQGYMKEATKAVIEYGFNVLNLHRIIATCQPENSPSKRLCEALKMRLEGTFKKCIKAPNNTWWDELFYAILQDEYKNE